MELQFNPDPARKAVYRPLRHIPLLCIQWKTPDDGRRNCPKHVDFQSKIKTFEKLVHLFGVIIRKVIMTSHFDREFSESTSRQSLISDIP
jgi:hypothetical protein